MVSQKRAFLKFMYVSKLTPTSLSPFDSNIAFLCQSIEINNNKHVYRQSHVRKPTGSEVEWAECSLIRGMGCRIEVFTWSSIAQSVCQRVFSLLAIWCLRHWVRILHSAEEDTLSPFDSNIACLCQSIEINNTHVCMYVCMHACMYVRMYVHAYVWMLAHHKAVLSSSRF